MEKIDLLRRKKEQTRIRDGLQEQLRVAEYSLAITGAMLREWKTREILDGQRNEDGTLIPRSRGGQAR
ncbi:MAG: hypothetical protein ABSF90_03565 [Syntrophobacteraceae bacterium]|jgi:hypothetical protein